MFDGFDNLQLVNFSNNYISFIGWNLFANATNLPRLAVIDLSGNHLTNLEPWPLVRGSTFPGTTVLLNSNPISTFSTPLFASPRDACLSNVDLRLRLQNTRLKHVSDIVSGWRFNTIEEFRNTVRPLKDFLVIASESFECHCIDSQLAEQLSDARVFDLLYCQTTEDSGEIVRKQFNQTPRDDLICDVTELCPMECDGCTRFLNNRTIDVRCAERRLKTLPDVLPLLPVGFKYRIDFSGNQLSDLEPRDYFADTVALDVSRCDLRRSTIRRWVTSAPSRSWT